MITQAQFLTTVRWALTAIGPAVLASGIVPANVWTIIVSVLVSLAPLVWGWITHSVDGTLAAAEALPGVQSIVIKRTASPAAIDAAFDTTRPKVVLAPTTGGAP